MVLCVLYQISMANKQHRAPSRRVSVVLPATVIDRIEHQRTAAGGVALASLSSTVAAFAVIGLDRTERQSVHQSHQSVLRDVDDLDASSSPDDELRASVRYSLAERDNAGSPSSPPPKAAA